MNWLMKTKPYQRRIYWAAVDALIIFCAAMFSLELRFEWNVPIRYTQRLLSSMGWMIAVYIALYAMTRLYSTLWRYAGGRTFFRLGFASAIAGAVTIVVNFYAHLLMPSSVLLLTAVFSFGFIALTRYSWRYLFSRTSLKLTNPVPARRTLVIGAGAAAAWVIAQYQERDRSIKPVAILDDDRAKQGLRIHGVPVVGAIDDVQQIVEAYAIEQIIIAIPTLKKKRFMEVASLCGATKLPVRSVSEPQALNSNKQSRGPVMRKLDFSEFLSRSEVALDIDRISGYLAGQVVLVTGGGGSIGSEICRQIMRFSPEKLIIFDIYENCAYELYRELTQEWGSDVPVEVCIGSVRDKARVKAIVERYKPSVVFHAAAHKHVPLMEGAPLEAIKNNIFGTRNVLEAADQSGTVERFVILSTDKAVNPTNVMGATKRVTEMLVQSYAARSKMKCMAVRFGNVLGSHGSVIPLFTRQIENGGPVTLTHAEITRYFMTIPEAAQLVLQAGGLAQSGAIYVLDMGEPMKIGNLAEQLIRFYGYEPYVDMQIEIVGLRPGEKLYEELMLDEEAELMEKTCYDLIMVAPPIAMDEREFWEHLRMLENVGENSEMKAIDGLRKLVKNFQRDMRRAG